MPLPESLPSSHRAALAWYVDVQAAEADRGADHLAEARRMLARHDLFFLLCDVLHRADINRPWLFARCREVQGEPDGRLDLWAREHYKSTIVTFGLTIFDILNNPEITVGIFSHSRPIAKGFLRQIKLEIEANADLRALFPDIFWADPAAQAPKWSEDEGIVVKRRSNPKESTIEAWGLVDGQPTGKHFSLRVYDDVVTRESVTTPEQIRKTTGAFELSDNLGAIGGVLRMVGTRYHRFDTYATLIERGTVVPRLHPATSDGSDDCRKAVLMPPDVLARKRRDQGPLTFACQMLQDPRADNAIGFQEAWLRRWPADSTRNLSVGLVVDPAHSRKREAGSRTRASDRTAMWVYGIGPDRKIRVIDGVYDRLDLPGRAAALFALHRRWRPLKVGYEEYGLQADIDHMQFLMQIETYEFDITPLGGALSKPERIARLVPLFERGDILLPHTLVRPLADGSSADLIAQFLREEYLAYPVSRHDDGLDALARVLDDAMALPVPGADKPRPVVAASAGRAADSRVGY